MRFGWCLSNHHDMCIKQYYPMFIERGKIYYKEELRVCSCECHSDQPKKRRRRRK